MEAAIQAPDPLFTFTAEDLKVLLSQRDPPCASIYLPTHRRRAEGRSDAILYRNLCRETERVLERDLPGPAAREVSERLRTLDREEFWEDGRRSDGLAVFVSPGFFACYRLPGQFPELNVVGGSFHTKPLLRFLQASSLSYHLLAVNAHRVALYEGHGSSLHEVPLVGVPQAPEVEDEAMPRSVRQRGADKIHYGQGGPKEHAKTDLEKFFRTVAKEVWKNHLRASTKPLILAAPAHEQPIFRRVAQIPVLLESGIAADPAKLSIEDLKAEAHRVLEPEIQSRIAKAKDAFGLARAKSHGTDVLQDVARAVVAGRVKLLLVESGRRIWGLLDTSSGEILPGDSSRNAHDIDLLDELAEAAIARGGDVFVLKKEDMPTAQGIAAVFRF